MLQNDEITYAELSLPSQQMPHVIYNQQSIPMSMMRRPEPIVYAQIDVTKRMPCLQPLSPPHPSTLATLHHPHQHTMLPGNGGYLGARQLSHEEQMSLMSQDSGANVMSSSSGPETPLIAQRDGAVSSSCRSTRYSGSGQIYHPHDTCL